MIKIITLLMSIACVSACSVQNPYTASNRSDFSAENASLVKKINLLDNDQENGITRNLRKVTEEIVDSNNNVHQKKITIQEKVNLNGATGNAEAVIVYDSANKTRSGNRTITLVDDGNNSLSDIVKNFEISKYKSIKNDQFKSQSDNVPNKTDNKAKKEAVKSQKLPLISETVGKKPKITSSELDNKIKQQDPATLHAWLQ